MNAHVKKILDHHEVTTINEIKGGFEILVNEQYWRITSKWHTKLAQDLSPTEDVYFGDYKWFYSRFVAKSFEAPENSGKKWTKEEDATLNDMMCDNYTILDIAYELKRDITSIAVRGAKNIGVNSSDLLKLNRESLGEVRFSEI